jgi:hypothetical protein
MAFQPSAFQPTLRLSSVSSQSSSSVGAYVHGVAERAIDLVLVERGHGAS